MSKYNQFDRQKNYNDKLLMDDSLLKKLGVVYNNTVDGSLCKTTKESLSKQTAT